MPIIMRPKGAIHCSSTVRPSAGFDCRQQPAIHDRLVALVSERREPMTVRAVAREPGISIRRISSTSRATSRGARPPSCSRQAAARAHGRLSRPRKKTALIRRSAPFSTSLRAVATRCDRCSLASRSGCCPPHPSARGGSRPCRTSHRDSAGRTGRYCSRCKTCCTAPDE